MANSKSNLAFSLETTGDFNGLSLVQNPDTGFLEGMPRDDLKRRITILENGGYGVSPRTLFNSETKLKLLSLLKDLWPDVTEACKRVGISRWTFNNHYAVDVEFRACIDEFRESNVDKIEKFRFEMAMRPNGTLDRMAVLNAYRKDIYNPDVKIQVNHSMSREEATQRDSITAHSIDAEIVQTYRKVKSKQSKELAKLNRENKR